jgi:hypothetical protein
MRQRAVRTQALEKLARPFLMRTPQTAPSPSNTAEGVW